jgi:signal transduction histidine kinase
VAWRLSGADEARMAVARGDELREVLLNVLENARLAGAREVCVTLWGGLPGDAALHVAVRDDGGGIPPEVLPRVFEPHFSTRTSGSGLGLAVSRRIVEGWGGSITLDSTPGAGTEVRVTLAAANP